MKKFIKFIGWVLILAALIGIMTMLLREPKGKTVGVEKIETDAEEIVFGGTELPGGSEETAVFTVDGIGFRYEEGMTFSDWAASEYADSRIELRFGFPLYNGKYIAYEGNI